MDSEAWLGLCEIPTPLCNEYDLQPFDIICLSVPSSTHHELTTVVLQTVPSSAPDEIRLHPFLQDFLCRALETSCADSERETGLTLAALAFEGADSINVSSASWKLDKVESCDDLADAVRLCATLLYCDGSAITERDLERSLRARLVKVNSVVATCTTKGFCLIVIQSIQVDDYNIVTDNVFRVGTQCQVTFRRRIDTKTNSEAHTENNFEADCPGYEELMEEVYILFKGQDPIRPTGVLLSGCPGVGKTRFASCLANHVIQRDRSRVHWVSCQDLMLRASWASETDLIQLVLPPSPTDANWLVVVDDLNIMDVQDSDENNLDFEYLLLRNSLIAALDLLSGVFVLGICRVHSDLPQPLVRIGRFEKVIHMEAPTKLQRLRILSTLLPDHPKWAKALTGPTAGFVAQDLQNVYTDALTMARSRSEEIMRWEDLREAAHRAVPSQLALLDVTRPSPIDGQDASPFEIHTRCWAKFGGYKDVKKRIFRTVVAPWRKRLGFENALGFGLSPPRGVLFHGRSGVGKSFAAHCLSESLGMNMVTVRASDVLDQWLGGSEAILRSLFDRARSASPCILFFDEIDAIASNREIEGAEGEVSSRILSTLLNEMDGVSSLHDSGVLVLACTNRLEQVDPALLRPGRLEEHIELKLPTALEIKGILELCFAKIPIASEVNLMDFAEVFNELGATPADIVGVVRDACSAAVKENRLGEGESSDVTYVHLDNALRGWKK